MQYTDLIWERAEKLAKLPRHRISEFGWAAVGGLAGSLPNAVDAILQILTQARKGSGGMFLISWHQLMDCGVFLFFLLLTSFALASGRSEPTSVEFLHSLFQKPVKASWLSRAVASLGRRRPPPPPASAQSPPPGGA